MLNILDDSVFIIAEAGVNHNGELEKARKLVNVAEKAGADAVKFQTFNPDKLVTKKAEKADYQKETTEKKTSQYEMIKKLRLSENKHKSLKNYCEEKAIMFISTPFDRKSADFLEDLGVKLFKVGSGELTNHLLLKHIARKNKPIILSTGMGNIGEVESAIEVIESTGFDNELILLHCVSNYPASIDDVNLRAMKTMHNAFKLPTGYSDHTLGDEIPIAGVAMGAKVIEKHFTLDKELKGPDHEASLEPNELQEMIRKIRNVETALGNGIKKCTDSEKSTKKVARKSLVAKRDIEKGEILNKENLTVKRPEEGIKADKYYEFLNRTVRAAHKIYEDEIIEWKDIFFG